MGKGDRVRGYQGNTVDAFLICLKLPEMTRSALPAKADITKRDPHVRFVPKADTSPPHR
jgi:hypothetical protein